MGKLSQAEQQRHEEAAESKICLLGGFSTTPSGTWGLFLVLHSGEHVYLHVISMYITYIEVLFIL